MTQRAAIAKALLSGKVLSTMTAFQDLFCTNLPREISRGIEKPFGLTISRDRVDFVSTYGQNGFYYRYRLNQTPQNAEGIKKMVQYIAENDPSAIMVAGAKIEKQKDGKTIAKFDIGIK